MRKMTPIERETLTKEVEFARARGKPITPAAVDERECKTDKGWYGFRHNGTLHGEYLFKELRLWAGADPIKGQWASPECANIGESSVCYSTRRELREAMKAA